MSARSKWMVTLMALQVGAIGALAADAGVEFGAEDDLLVNGQEGNLQDADLEVKGYSVFGNAAGLAVPVGFTNGPGSVVIVSNLFVGGQLKAAAGIDLQGANMTVSNLTIQGALVANGSNVQLQANTSASTNLSVGHDLTVGNNASVTGNAGVGGSLQVGGGATVGGPVTVDGVATFATNVVINGTTPSADKDTGALVVNGGVGVEQNLNVGGNAGVGGNAAVSGNATVGGTLGVTGDATLGSNLGVAGAVNAGSANVAGNTTVGGTLTVTGAIQVASATLSGNAQVGGTLAVAGAASVADTTQSVDKDTGALVLEGGLGVEKNLNAGGNVTALGSAGVGTATPDANTRLDVRGGGNSGDYAAKFYVGGDVAAWVRKK